MPPVRTLRYTFPHLRVGTFIEAISEGSYAFHVEEFPHLRVGTFIEALIPLTRPVLRTISPPSGGDFH